MGFLLGISVLIPSSICLFFVDRLIAGTAIAGVAA
jgi:hypothetical protein